MKKKLLFLLLTSSAIYAHQHADGETSHTFFAYRHWYGTDLPIYFSNTRYLSNLKEDGRGGLFQALVYGGQTTNPKALARYFCPFNLDTLTIEENELAPGDYQVLGANLNIATVNEDFKSIVKFRPKESVVGISFNFKQEFGDKWWIEGSFPIEHATTNVQIEETIINDGGGLDVGGGGYFNNDNDGYANFTQAIQAPGLKYGRIDGKQSTVGIADVEIRGGYKTINNKNFYWFSYLGILLPGGNKPKAEYMFEPIRGNGGHVVITMGSDFGFPWIERQSFTLTVEGGINGGYSFQTIQKRSFDLNNKQWGRYLAVTPQVTTVGNGVGNYGINVLTQDFKVTPRSYRAITLGLLLDHLCGFQAEAGYQFFGRQREHIELASDNWNDRIGLYDIVGNTTSTASARTINNNANGQTDSTFIQITESDLDFASAVQPSTVTYVFYGSLAKTFDTEYPVLLGLGAEYEVGSSNENMDRWTAWFKADIMF